MELHLPALLRIVSVDILHLHHLGHISHNVDDPVEIIVVHHLQHLLTQKFTQLRVQFSFELRIFLVQLLYVHCQSLNQIFCAGILHRHFFGHPHLFFNLYSPINVNVRYFGIGHPKSFENLLVKSNVEIRVVISQLLELSFIQLASHSQFLTHNGILFILSPSKFALFQFPS